MEQEQANVVEAAAPAATDENEGGGGNEEMSTLSEVENQPFTPAEELTEIRLQLSRLDSLEIMQAQTLEQQGVLASQQEEILSEQRSLAASLAQFMEFMSDVMQEGQHGQHQSVHSTPPVSIGRQAEAQCS